MVMQDLTNGSLAVEEVVTAFLRISLFLIGIVDRPKICSG